MNYKLNCLFKKVSNMNQKQLFGLEMEKKVLENIV